MLPVLIFLCLLAFVGASDDRASAADKLRLMGLAAGAFMVMFPSTRPKKRRRVSCHRIRTRRSVGDIFREMGPYYVRRAYRMHEHQFWKLHEVLKAGIARPKSTRKKHRNGGKNGIISTETRLR